MSKELTRAWNTITEEWMGEAQRAKYQRAIKVLQTIPSGTHDEDLTAEQRQAWIDHGEALAYFETNR